MVLSARREAALRAAVAAIPGAVLRVPRDEDAVANWEARTRPAAVAAAVTPDGWARLIRAVREAGLPLAVRAGGQAAPRPRPRLRREPHPRSRIAGDHLAQRPRTASVP